MLLLGLQTEMRKLKKAEKPDILAANETGWTIELLATPPHTPEYKVIERRYGHPEIRERLADETHHKCAYCESRMEAVSFPHIEHILPKSRHREKTFEWDNLTVACQVCNTKKDTREPTADNFVHPYTDEPEQRFHFFGAFMASKNGELSARNMINWLELNRSPLVVSRNEVVNRVVQIYLEAISLQREARREFLDLSLAPLLDEKSPYSLVATCVAANCESEYANLINA